MQITKEIGLKEVIGLFEDVAGEEDSSKSEILFTFSEIRHFKMMKHSWAENPSVENGTQQAENGGKWHNQPYT